MIFETVFAGAILLAAPQDVLHREDTGRFECPDPAMLDDREKDALAGALVGRPEAMADENDLRAVARLFLEHGFTTDQTVNQLVSAYCPVIARNASLNTYEKTAKVQAFADVAFDIVSSQAPAPDPNRW